MSRDRHSIAHDHDARLVAMHTKIDELLLDVLKHPGFGDIRIDVRWLKRGQKEVVITCAKQHRFVVPVDGGGPVGPSASSQATAL